ncbi:hypothetical protein [Escherichia coli]|uniref:hypothetical protein n=1 Tax=Escherichia coli TaxID=562 RepID=UPI0011BF815D|nr:hypothetical protein [Escherichia coli]QED50326.1 hypothetical protein FQR64_00005 [Escherichia coli]
MNTITATVNAAPSSMSLLTLKEVRQRMNEGEKLSVIEIYEQTFDEVLEVEPLKNCCYEGITASFMLNARYRGNVRDIFARVSVGMNQYRFFHFRDLCTLKHDEIVERCKTFMQQ